MTRVPFDDIPHAPRILDRRMLNLARLLDERVANPHTRAAIWAEGLNAFRLALTDLYEKMQPMEEAPATKQEHNWITSYNKGKPMRQRQCVDCGLWETELSVTLPCRPLPRDVKNL